MTPTTGERHPLSSDLIQRRALDLVSREGLEALTLRRLADELQVWPTALYHYVGSKDGLVQLALDGALAELEIPDDALPWDDWLRCFSAAGRTVLLRYPGLARHLEEHGNRSRTSYAVTNRALGVLLRDGFDPRDAVLLYTAVFSIVTTMVRRTESLGGPNVDRYRHEVEQHLSHLRETAHDFDALLAVAEHWATVPPEAYAAFAIDTLLNGADSRRRTPG